jgi:hypothetical protein
VRSLQKFSFAGAAVAATAALVFSSAPANADVATYYPEGPQSNVAKSTVTDGGWTLCWAEAYGGVADMNAVQAGTDDGSVVACDGDVLLLTGWADSASDTLIALAAAPRSEIFTETPYADDSGTPYARGVNGWNTHCWTPGNIHTTPHLVNGSYWYYTPGCSMGFSPTRDIDTWPGDSCPGDVTQPYRLSWHMYDGAHPESVNGGFSLGNNCWLNDSTTYTRAIYTATTGSITDGGSETESEPEETQNTAESALADTGNPTGGLMSLGAVLLVAGALSVWAVRRRNY